MGKDVKSTPSGTAPKAPGSIANGEVSTGKLDTKSSSAGHTPVQKHRSVVSLPLPPTEPTPKRDSSVFEMIAGTKSE